MARARNIKPGFFANEILGEADPFYSLLFIGLWTLADREGRLEDRPRKIRAQIFPFRDDTTNVDAMLAWLTEAGFIIRYEARGQKYIQVENFAKHQQPHYKEVASEIPPPPGRRNSLTTPGGVPESVRQTVFDRDGRKCQKCGGTERLSIDHVVPRSKGGGHCESNLWTLCSRCNSAKRSRQPRHDEGPTLAQDRTDVESSKSLHDPLIPDSLLSDSGLPSRTNPSSTTVLLPFPSERFAEAWQNWTQHRREKKKPLTPTSVKQQLKELAGMGEERAIRAIEHSIAGGYQGIFEPHQNGQTSQPKETIAEMVKRIAAERDAK